MSLAEVAEVEPSTVQRIEKRERGPSRKMVEKLARALAPDGASEEEIEQLVSRAMFAAGFIPTPGGLPEIEREVDADELFSHLDGYDGTDPRLIAAKGVARQIDEILKHGKIVTSETPEDELSGQSE